MSKNYEMKQGGFKNCKVVHNEYVFTYHKRCTGKTYIYHIDDERKAFLKV